MALKISLHPGRVRGLPDQVWDRTRKFKLAITSGDAHIMPLDPPPRPIQMNPHRLGTRSTAKHQSRSSPIACTL